MNSNPASSKRKFPLLFYAVEGDSMNPIFSRGDLVLVHRTSDCKKLHVIAFTDPEIGIILHRIVALTDDGYITRGDNNTGQDPCTVTPDRIAGKVIARIPWLGLLRLLFR